MKCSNPQTTRSLNESARRSAKHCPLQTNCTHLLKYQNLHQSQTNRADDVTRETPDSMKVKPFSKHTQLRQDWITFFQKIQNPHPKLLEEPLPSRETHKKLQPQKLTTVPRIYVCIPAHRYIKKHAQNSSFLLRVGKNQTFRHGLMKSPLSTQNSTQKLNKNPLKEKEKENDGEEILRRKQRENHQLQEIELEKTGESTFFTFPDVFLRPKK